ncbi:hypothetical protein FTO70_03720 [Methanosarcina sp. KYL-1]|uniref:hypothetical protein n=1 Tax=Methanosarcina sp. KYL-1 TaxID=2602068 RepID=UPI00210154FA|nr:hypothetical protein [Methanosarcina sp. KYL-1]MCQ1534812.1 hypothetical protein [Methanosarcina sp. KYL-1]
MNSPQEINKQDCRKTINLGPDVFEILTRVVDKEKQYDSYSAAVRRAVRSTFGEKEGVPA